MTFFEWMNDKYPDPDSPCGELTVYLCNIDALKTAVAYADFIPYLFQHSMPNKMLGMFNGCWHRYCEDCFWFSDFLHDCCRVEPYETEKSGVLIEAYRRYSLSKGRPPHASSVICNELTKHGFKRRKTKHGVLISGLRLRNA